MLIICRLQIYEKISVLPQKTPQKRQDYNVFRQDYKPGRQNYKSGKKTITSLAEKNYSLSDEISSFLKISVIPLLQEGLGEVTLVEVILMVVTLVEVTLVEVTLVVVTFSPAW